MQPMTADNKPNILEDIKRDHAHFFSLHRRFQEELGLSDHDKQVLIWQASETCKVVACNAAAQQVLIAGQSTASNMLLGCTSHNATTTPTDLDW